MGRDKGKFNKRGGRGGGSRFQATSAEEIEQRNSRIAEFDERRAQRRAEEDDAEGGGGEEEEAELEKKVAEIDLRAGNVNREPKPLTRKQREEADRERKAAEYRKRHEAGLTDEYKRDMEKLAEVKRRREEASKKADAEKEFAEALEAERKSKAAAVMVDDDDDDDDDSDDDAKKSKKKKSKKKADIPKLDKIAMKKMKPAQLKEALKTRGLDIQGNAKALLKRLADHEGSR
jgi:hypothetical protein